MKQAVILAGGKGTRLRERLGDLPKPLIDVCGTPLLERQIHLLKRYGFERVIILVNYKAEHIEAYCAGKNYWGLQMVCIDDGKPRGTAGAVLRILDMLDEEFLVLYGDTMLEVDLGRFHRYHREGGNAAATLFLHPNDHPHDSDLVELDDNGNIIGFFPYPHDNQRFYSNLVNAALYWVRRSALEPWRDHKGMLDFGKALFPAMIARGMTLRGYNSPEYIKDCGTPKRIDKVCQDYRSGRIERAALDHPQQAVFIDRDGTLNREVDHLKSPEQFELLPGVENAVRRLNLAEYRVCVVTNQPVIARGECSEEMLRQIHNKMETLLGLEGAYLDRLYYCPHHPDKGFEGEVPELKIACECRKPETGMIDAAVEELNISRRDSWLVGDSTADILAAKRSGLRSILVETGYAGLDDKHWARPDFVVPDLSAAVNFILYGYSRLINMLRSYVVDIGAGALVFIGGLSRSGKSTLATAMSHVLTEAGHQCHVISTDRWLLNAERRGEGVLARHDIRALSDFVRTLLNQRPYETSLPGYRRSRREQVSNVDHIKIESDDVVIIEGVIALYLADLVDARHRFFVELHEQIRRKRVEKEYSLRGESAESASNIYLERLEDEAPWVISTADKAIRLTVPAEINMECKNNDY